MTDVLLIAAIAAGCLAIGYEWGCTKTWKRATRYLDGQPLAPLLPERKLQR